MTKAHQAAGYNKLNDLMFRRNGESIIQTGAHTINRNKNKQKQKPQQNIKCIKWMKNQTTF